MIYVRVHPIDLRTPNSHIESLMLALIVMISWKRPKTKQIVEVHREKKSTILRFASMSSTICGESPMTIYISSLTAMIEFAINKRSSLGLLGKILHIKLSLSKP